MTESGERERFEKIADEVMANFTFSDELSHQLTRGIALEGIAIAYRAGSASQGAAMKRRYLTDQEACPECDGTCRISEGNKLVCYHCWLMETASQGAAPCSNRYHNAPEGHRHCKNDACENFSVAPQGEDTK